MALQRARIDVSHLERIFRKPVNPGTMRYLSVAGNSLTILLDGGDTGGAYTLMESILPPGGGPPRHVHHREDEGFLVMAGEVTFHVGDEAFVRKEGQYLFAPRDIPHQFVNTGHSEAIVLETAMPSGIEIFFDEIGTPIPARNACMIPFSAEARARMIAAAPKYGVEILLPRK